MFTGTSSSAIASGVVRDLAGCSRSRTLPGQFQRKLYLPGSCVGQVNRTREGNTASVGVDDGSIIVWRLEIRAVQNIEDLCPELHVEVFRNCPERQVLYEREIEIHEARANQRIAPLIAQQRAGIWGGETLELDVLIGIAGINIRSTAWRHEAIGVLVWVRVVHAKRIPGNQDRKRSTGLGVQNSTELPSAQNRLSRRSERRRRGDVPDVIEREVVPNIGVGEAAPALIAKDEKGGY